MAASEDEAADSVVVAEESVPEEQGGDEARPPTGNEIADGLLEHFFTAEFFEKHWETYPLHWRASEHGPHANRLPDVLTPGEFIDIVRRSGGNLKVFKNNEPYNEDNFLIAYLDGASLIINQVDRCNEVLYDICRTLADALFHHVFAVSYLTPPNSQTVGMHTDDQDTFLMQVWGRKHWKLRGAPHKRPYTEEMLGKNAPVPEELIGPVIMEFTIEPHDILFIPRGFLHEASCADEPSLHITVTVPTSDYCWGVQLTKHLMRSARMRPGVPPHLHRLCETSLSGPGCAGIKPLDEEKLNAQIKELVDTLISDLRPEDVLETFQRQMVMTNEGQANTHKMAMSKQLPPFVKEESRVRLMHGVTVRDVQPECEIAIFQRASDGQRLELCIAPTAVALIQALTARPQRVVDLPCADRFERLCVLNLLHKQGVVQLFLRGADERTIPG